MPYILEPEVAGGWGAETVADRSCHPPRVAKLVYEFEGWGGDDLLTTFPCYIVTQRLADQIQSSSLSGYKLAPVEITKSEVFLELNPDKKLPEFQWLQVDGKAGAADFALNSNHRLVVSEAAFKVVSSCNLANCEVERC